MNPYWIIVLSSALIFLGVLLVALKGVTRRKRLWFVGGGRSALARLKELKALQLRELKDQQEGFESGKIDKADYEESRDTLVLEIAETSKQIEVAESKRNELRDRFKLPMLLLTVMLFAAPIGAQEALEVKSEYKAREEFGTVRFELRDSQNEVRDYSEVVVVAIVLEENDIPFNELTQSNWTGMFRRVAGIDAPSGIGTVMSLKSTTPKGYAWRSNPSGKFSVHNLLLETRLAFAAYHQGIWWPMVGERYLPKSGARRDVVINISDVSTDVSKLEVSEYTFDVVSTPAQLRWHQLYVEEKIVIRNPTRKAISGVANEDGDAWLRFSIPRPPGIEGTLVLNSMASSFNVFVGTPQVSMVDDYATELQAVKESVAPYVPWSKNLDWGESNGGHGGSGVRKYKTLNAKDSGSFTHPLNSDDQFALYGPGDIGFSVKGEELYVHVYKPVPPNGTLVVKLSYKPGMSFEDPQPIVVDRSDLVVPIRDLRALVFNPYGFSAKGAAVKQEPYTGQRQGMRMYLAEKRDDGFIAPAASPLFFNIEPTQFLEEFLDQLLEEEENSSTGSNAMANPHPSAANNKKPIDEGELKFSSLMWLLAVLFGLGFLVSILWIARGDAEVQMAKIETGSVDEEQALEELLLMREEAEGGRLPARAYLQERNRIIEGLISSKLREKEKKG